MNIVSENAATTERNLNSLSSTVSHWLDQKLNNRVNKALSKESLSTKHVSFLSSPCITNTVQLKQKNASKSPILTFATNTHSDSLLVLQPNVDGSGLNNAITTSAPVQQLLLLPSNSANSNLKLTEIASLCTKSDQTPTMPIPTMPMPENMKKLCIKSNMIAIPSSPTTNPSVNSRVQITLLLNDLSLPKRSYISNLQNNTDFSNDPSFISKKLSKFELNKNLMQYSSNITSMNKKYMKNLIADGNIIHIVKNTTESGCPIKKGGKHCWCMYHLKDGKKVHTLKHGQINNKSLKKSKFHNQPFMTYKNNFNFLQNLMAQPHPFFINNYRNNTNGMQTQFMDNFKVIQQRQSMNNFNFQNKNMKSNSILSVIQALTQFQSHNNMSNINVNPLLFSNIVKNVNVSQTIPLPSASVCGNLGGYTNYRQSNRTQQLRIQRSLNEQHLKKSIEQETIPIMQKYTNAGQNKRNLDLISNSLVIGKLDGVSDGQPRKKKSRWGNIKK